MTLDRHKPHARLEQKNRLLTGLDEGAQNASFAGRPRSDTRPKSIERRSA